MSPFMVNNKYYRRYLTFFFRGKRYDLDVPAFLTNIGNWLWHTFWYRFDWWLGERKFAKWVRYGKKHALFVKFESWEQLHQWEERMLEMYENPKRASVFNIFKSYTKWPRTK